jgi:hypothetical protein
MYGETFYIHHTAQTTLLRAIKVMNELGQSHTPVIFDMGLLSKALEFKVKIIN